MAMTWFILSMVALNKIVFGVHGEKHQSHENYYEVTDTWVVEVEGGKEIVQLLAEEHHYEYLGEVTGFVNHYKLVKKVNYSISDGVIHESLQHHPKVVWSERQYKKPRSKRGYILNIKEEKARQFERLYNERQEDHTQALREKRGLFSWFWSRYIYFFNDALWSKQWYLQDYRADGQVPVLDLNVVPCYAIGITGKGIKISVLDDGLEWTHPDLTDNYEPDISADIIDGDKDPMPSDGYRHGTRCAGEIAMKADNKICGVGIAFNARIGGIKMLSSSTTDVMEATSFIYAMDKVDIYSNSWGPLDDGKTLEGPGKLAKNALKTGVSKGRKGKGAIYVFAAGNGKKYGDNCAADGYINSLYTIPIASASQRGDPPYYSERCSAVFATAYSSGGQEDEKIATTDVNGGCTTNHSGTSAAAPLAAGIFALTLQANPNLTWRCLLHVVAWTAEVAVLSEDDDWQINNAGFWLNPSYGFGLLNAYNMVKFAKKFVTVPEKSVCPVYLDERFYNTSFSNQRSAVFEYETTGCSGTVYEINFLEHVLLKTSVTYPYRGAIEIFLTSPHGMKTTLMESRPDDRSSKGLTNWEIKSVHNWGESPHGTWKVKIKAKGPPDFPAGNGTVLYANIILHGTRDMPQHYQNGRRQYSTYSSTMNTEQLYYD